MKLLKRGRVFVRWLPVLMVVFLMSWIMWFFSRVGNEAVAEDDTEGIARMEILLYDATSDDLNLGGKHIEYAGEMILQGEESVGYYDITIEGRGNTTWAQEKKPYQIKLDRKDNILDLSNGRKWILLANYLDASFLRNDLAFYFAKTVGERYVNSGEFVELSINGEAMGLYYLTNKIEISKNSVDIRDEMGILVEYDSLWSECDIVSNDGACFIVKDLVDEMKIEEASDIFIKSYNELEEAVKSGNFESIKDIIDIESFAQYYLISEFTVNPDAYRTSWKMYKDGADGKIYAGPVWDFDLALGNREWKGWILGETFSPENEMEQKIAAYGGEYSKDGQIFYIDEDADILRLMYELMDMAEFRNEVGRVYCENVLGKEDDILKRLVDGKKKIERSAREDGLIWNKDEFDEEFEFLYDWVEKRLEFMKNRYGEELI